MIMNIIRSVVFVLLICACSSNSNKAENEVTTLENPIDSCLKVENKDVLKTIDVTKKYPHKEIILQDIANVEYIALETNKDVLLNNDIGSIRLVSDSNIIAVNPKSGYCYRFNREGKILSYFLHKGNGPAEYNNIVDAIVDEQKQEIYIYDYGLKYRIQVYSFDGQYKRTLPLQMNMFVNSAHNFQSDYILSNDVSGSRNKSISKPYMLLSKETGKIKDVLDISFNNRILPYFYLKKDEHTTMTVKLSYNSTIKYDDNYIIGDISSDTIYLYSKERSIKPLLTRIPSVYDMETPVLLIPDFKTEKYFFLTTVVREFDFNTMTGLPDTRLIYDYAQDEIFEYVLKNNDSPSQVFELNRAGTISHSHNNTIYQIIEIDKLKEDMKKGKVSGKLKEMASKLKDDDNPILMIITFK